MHAGITLLFLAAGSGIAVASPDPGTSDRSETTRTPTLVAGAADVSFGSGSVPHLNDAGDAWEPFDAVRGAPTKGGLVVVYAPTDLTAFPLDATEATVTLRPETSGSPLTCTHVTEEPELTKANVGQCFFSGDFDRVRIYYIGELEVAGDIRYTIEGVANAADSDTFEPFDSDDLVPGDAPTPEAGRPPARLLMVLDRSGSMDWSSHPFDEGCNGFSDVSPSDPCGPSRWDVLSRAVDATLTIADAYKLPGDEIAVAPFNDSVSSAERIGLVPLDNTAIDAVRELVQEQIDPSGTTSIGAGLVEFESSFAPVAADERTQSVLLFTDGDQNRPPYVVFNDNDVLINETSEGLTGDVRAYAADPPGEDTARVCPFALRHEEAGEPLGTAFTHDIATRRCESTVFTTVSVEPTEPELIQYFAEILNSTLIGDKLEIAAVRSGSVTGGPILSAAGETSPDMGEERFVTSSRDVAFTVLLTWADAGNDVRDIVLEKDGVAFHAGPRSRSVLMDRGPSHVAVTLRQPFRNDSVETVPAGGEWTLRFRPASKTGGPLRYNAYIIVDNATVASSFRVGQSTPGVGRPIDLRVGLEEDGAPIAGLPDGAVRAVVGHPGAGLGNELAAGDAEPVDNTAVDSISAAGRKLVAMLGDSASRERVLAALRPTGVDTLVLTEAEPGIYAAQYDRTGAEGAYPVRFLVDAETPDNGPFTRTFVSSEYVPVVVDEDATAPTIDVTELMDCPYPGGCFGVTLRPEDAAGNLIGPGKASLVSLADFDGELLEPVVDNLDGTYTVGIGYPAGVRGQPTIDIYGVQIQAPIPGKGGFLDFLPGPWWIWLILLLVIIAVVLLRRPAATP